MGENKNLYYVVPTFRDTDGKKEFSVNPKRGYYNGNTPEEAMGFAVRRLNLERESQKLMLLEVYRSRDAYHLAENPVARLSGKDLTWLINEDSKYLRNAIDNCSCGLKLKQRTDQRKTKARVF